MNSNKIWFGLNTICGCWWIYLIYDSMVTQNITNLRSNAVLGSILSVILFIELALNNLKK